LLPSFSCPMARARGSHRIDGNPLAVARLQPLRPRKESDDVADRGEFRRYEEHPS
jgi:hypothetical protein